MRGLFQRRVEASLPWLPLAPESRSPAARGRDNYRRSQLSWACQARQSGRPHAGLRFRNIAARQLPICDVGIAARGVRPRMLLCTRTHTAPHATHTQRSQPKPAMHLAMDAAIWPPQTGQAQASASSPGTASAAAWALPWFAGPANRFLVPKSANIIIQDG